MNIKSILLSFLFLLLATSAQAEQMVVLRTHAFGME